MSLYEQLVNQAQMNYSKYYYQYYAMGKCPYALAKPSTLTYEQKIQRFIQEVKEADCIIVGAASGLSAAGGGDFYYANNDSYKKYFKVFEEKYHFDGAFAGMMHPFMSREEHWGYLTTFLYTTLTAPVRKPYLDLHEIIKDKDFYILTTNQDTQFMRLYDESKVSQIQGDHRYFQCKRQCCDEIWESTDTILKLKEAMKDTRFVPREMIPHCPKCGSELFPWVRGYGNFLQGTRYNEEYQKMSDYLESHIDKKILFIELGVGRMTPMFIQEPFWNLCASLDNAKYIAINDRYDLLPKQLEEKGMVIVENIAKVLEDVKNESR